MSSINLTDQQTATLIREARDEFVAYLIREHAAQVKLLSPAQVCGLLDIRNSTLTGLNIPRVNLGGKTIKYRLSDVTTYIESRLER
ncbi:MAG: hypothetical protein EOP88_18295 [Verrucomicrobiaceae bacterium]|nr:MAG: hypothetical protein EOP88_18295 [Verrucomicrobiaceae bacterium]